MDVTCGYTTYIRWVLFPFYYSCATPFQIAPAVSQGTYEGPVAQALELYNN